MKNTVWLIPSYDGGSKRSKNG